MLGNSLFKEILANLRPAQVCMRADDIAIQLPVVAIQGPDIRHHLDQLR